MPQLCVSSNIAGRENIQTAWKQHTVSLPGPQPLESSQFQPTCCPMHTLKPALRFPYGYMSTGATDACIYSRPLQQQKRAGCSSVRSRAGVHKPAPGITIAVQALLAANGWATAADFTVWHTAPCMVGHENTCGGLAMSIRQSVAFPGHWW